MNPKAWLASLVWRPTIIDEPGQYVTRGGEVVTVHAVAGRGTFPCTGQYPTGQRECWHKSGRLFFGQESSNDIVRKA